jgi:3-oxoacyl-[acyl-carrier protein] reductase
LTKNARRTALVTGGASGIGAGIVRRLASDGVGVGIFDLDTAAAERLAQTIVAEGGVAWSYGCDVSDPASVSHAVERFVEAEGRIDALVNNAGILTPEKALTEVSADEFDRILRVNLRSQFLMSQAVVPSMMTNRQGRIVNIASRSWLGGSGIGAYAASKGAVLSLTRSLALELGVHGITCNAVSPALVDTPMFRAMAVAQQDADLRKTALNPIPRLGQVEDIAQAVAFFCAAESGFITGQHLYVSGGADLLTSGIGT